MNVCDCAECQHKFNQNRSHGAEHIFYVCMGCRGYVDYDYRDDVKLKNVEIGVPRMTFSRCPHCGGNNCIPHSLETIMANIDWSFEFKGAL